MSFVYTGMRVRNLERSLRFYKRVMGMKELMRGTMPTGGNFVHLGSPRSQQRLELNYYPPGAKYYEKYKSGSELDHIAFWEKDVDKRYGELIAKGAERRLRRSQARLMTCTDGLQGPGWNLDRRMKNHGSSPVFI